MYHVRSLCLLTGLYKVPTNPLIPGHMFQLNNVHYTQNTDDLLLSRVCNNSGEPELLALEVTKSLATLYGTSALLTIF